VCGAKFSPAQQQVRTLIWNFHAAEDGEFDPARLPEGYQVGTKEQAC